MGNIEKFEDLEVWKKSAQIAIDILNISRETPLKNEFGLKDQIQKSAFSISSNIAEGYEYNNNPDFIRFLRYAKGSSGELRSQLNILCKTGLIPEDFYNQIYNRLVDTSKQVAGFIKHLKSHKQNLILIILNFAIFNFKFLICNL